MSLAADMNQNMARYAAQKASDALMALGYTSFAVVVATKAEQHVTCAVAQGGQLNGMGDALSDSMALWAEKHIAAELPDAPADSARA